MTLTGSLKNDFFALAAAIGVLGVFLGLGNLFLALQLPVFIVVIIAAFSKMNGGGRGFIPGNIEFGGLTFIAGTYVIKMAAYVGAMMGSSMFGVLAGFAVAFVLLHFAEIIGAMFMQLVSGIVASMGLAPQYSLLIFIVVLFALFFLLGAISPVLSTAIGLCIWGWFAMQRAGQLTGWNDTQN
jgi:hypothetical protein